MSKCTNCGENDLEYAPLPHHYHPGKSLSLFGWRLFIYRDKPEPIDNLCSDCLLDRQQSHEQDRFDDAADYGYQKGYEAGLNER